MSSALRKSLQECEPFKEDGSTVVCIGCFKLLAFPSGAKKIICPGCQTLTTGIKIKCTACSNPMQVRLGSSLVRCRKCDYQFKPQAKLKIFVPQEKRKDEIPKPITVKIVVDNSVAKCEVRTKMIPLIASQPLRTNATYWEDQLGAVFRSIGFFCKDKQLDSKKTPKELGLVDNDVIQIRQTDHKSSNGHEFVTAQFGQPTNCAVCKTFIFGIYNQGKKCAKCQVPVHHRCAETFNGLCEADLRQLFGIVNFNDYDDEGDEAPTLAVIIDDGDKEAFANCVQEAVEPECDKNFMSGLDKISNFTDEQISEIWLHYDKDGSGALERDEMKAFMADLLGFGGGKWDDKNSEEAVDRMMHRLDTNGDGMIDWQEFWFFVKAQQDAKYLESFSGVTLTTEKLYEMWYHYDVDGSGTLEADEMIALMQDISQLSGSTKKIDFKSAKFESLLGPSKKVSWDEFCTIIVPLIKSGIS
jgi:LSD1 subclass zinc finger protein